MKAKLSIAKKLGPLDSLSIIILLEDLKVNLNVLQLNALGLESHVIRSHKGYVEIKEMKRAGLIKTGKFNKEDDEVLMVQWKVLLRLTGLKEEDLKKELCMLASDNSTISSLSIRSSIHGVHLPVDITSDLASDLASMV